MSSPTTISLKVTEFKQGFSAYVDEHPVVNDKDYCDVVEVCSTLSYAINGDDSYGIRGDSKDDTREDLLAKAIPQVIFNEWYEENWLKCFSDFGLEAPVIYDHEEDTRHVVNDIDDYYNNCRDDANYGKILAQLQEIAEKEYVVKVVE